MKKHNISSFLGKLEKPSPNELLLLRMMAIFIGCVVFLISETSIYRPDIIIIKEKKNLNSDNIFYDIYDEFLLGRSMSAPPVN